MKKLKVCLRLYRNQDIFILVYPIIISTIFFMTDYIGISKGSVISVNFVSNTAWMMCMVIDYPISLGFRFIMFSNFTSNRKVFFNSIKIMVVVKSFIYALYEILILQFLQLFCKHFGYKFILSGFGTSYKNLSVKLNFIIFITFFAIILTCYSINVMFSLIMNFCARTYVIGIIVNIVVFPVLSILLLILQVTQSYTSVKYWLIFIAICLSNFIWYKICSNIIRTKASITAEGIIKLPLKFLPSK